MSARLTLGAAVLAAFGLVASAAAVDRAAGWHTEIYSIRPDGKDRRLIAIPDPPVGSLVRSPDGRRIAFVRDGGLYVADLSGANAIPLTSAPGAYGGAAFSADGTKLAFSSYTNCGWRCYTASLYVANVNGTGLRLVAERGENPSWSPDGTRLVYQGEFGLQVARVAGGPGDRVVALGSSPTWAPRGNRIAYLGFKGGYAVPCFVGGDGSHPVCLHGFSAVWKPVWSRDGKRIAFTRATPVRLEVVGADGRGLHEIARFTSTYRRPRPLAWSPDGRRIAYSYGSAYQQIHVRPVSGRGTPIRVTNELKQGYFGDVRWREGRISYVIYVE